MMTREQAQKLAEKILKLSTFPECSISISSGEQCYTRFANNGITLAGFSSRHGVSISSTKDGRTGNTSVNDLDDAALRAAIERSEQLAAIAPPNSERMPPPGPQEYKETPGFDERTAAARSPEMIPHVKAIIDLAQGKKLVAAGMIDRTDSSVAIADKSGLFGYHRSTDCRLSTTVRTSDGSSSGWAGQPAVRIADLDGARLAAVAVEKCARWKNPKKLDPGNYTVLLEPTAAGDLVRLMSGAFNARATEEGRTFLSKRGGGTLLGEKLFPEFVTLRNDPFDPRMPSAPWSADRLPVRPISWIEKGVIKNLAYDRYWAAKTGKAPTPSPGGGIMDGSDATLESLIAGVDRGLLVTHFWYIRFVNSQTLQYTGLTRNGLFLIEKGQISEAVMNFRFNESPVRMLKNTVKLGQARRVRGLEGGSMIAPAIVANDFAFTSISDAV